MTERENRAMLEQSQTMRMQLSAGGFWRAGLTGLLCILILSAHSPQVVAADEVRLIYVEPKHSRSFSPQRVTQAGTVFHIKVLTKADDNAFRLQRCREQCKTAETIKVWQPVDYRVGDELSFRVDRDGTYYLWAQDTRDDRSLEATTHWFVGTRTRIAFESGAVIETWYDAP